MSLNSAHTMKNIAAGLLALALAGIAVVLVAGQKMVAEQGPSTLGVTSADTLWVAVNQEIWALDAAGHRVLAKSVAAIGLDDAPSNIVPLPDGTVLAAVRGDGEWLVLDAKSMSRLRAIRPQWPAEFQDNVRALHIAGSPDGTFAASTGGGHTVLLFDAQGRLLARTSPGMYRFTNGVRWSPEGWWTTDTNRSRLHLLDGKTLQLRQTLELAPTPAPNRFLGELVASQGRARLGDAPIGTITKLGFLMEAGYVVDVYADGTQERYNNTPVVLRGIAWFNQRLIAVDGAAFELMQFDSERKRLAPFGDTAVREELADMRARREFWRQLSSRWGFVPSLLLMLAGIGAYARHKKLAERAIIEQRPASADLPKPAATQLALQRLWIYGVPIAVRLTAVAAGVLVLSPFALRLLHVAYGVAPLLWVNAMVLGAAVPLYVAALWHMWWHERLMKQPRYEQVLNARGYAWFHEHADWERVALPGESRRESIFAPGWNSRWLLVTNMRVLVFAASARERKLLQAWPRADVVYAGRPEDAPDGKAVPLFRRLNWPMPNLLIVFRDGSRVSLRCASQVSADRVARVLMGNRPLPAALPSPKKSASRRARWHEVVASFLVPGSGQWMQGRFTTGTVLFAAAALLFVFGWGPVLWASWGPKMDVQLATRQLAAIDWFLVSALAAWDAYRFIYRADGGAKAVLRA